MGLAAIAILTVLVIVVLPAAALIRGQRLESRILLLEKSLRHLKAELAARPAPPPPAAEGTEEAETPSPSEAPQAGEAREAPEAASEAASGPAPSDASSTAPPAPPPPPPTSRPAPAPRPSLEEKLGTSWTIWVGGLALALGGLFLVRYSIEYGLLGPKVRLGLAALLALALSGLGELLRRRDVRLKFAGAHAAEVPAILTAAGVITGFGAVYAAFALYHFLSPLAAFALLGAVSLAGLALSAVHGPGLAALGLVGSYATPVLAGGETKTVWGLLIYLLFVTAASCGAARLRGWLWLAIAANIGAIGWGVLVLSLGWKPVHAAPLALYIIGLGALALALLAARHNTEPADGDLISGHDLPGLVGMAAISLLGLALLRQDGYGAAALTAFFVLALMQIGSAWAWPGLRLLAPWGALLAALAMAGWHIPHLPLHYGPFDAAMGLTPIAPPELAFFLMISGALAALYGAAGLAGALRQGGRRLWPWVSVLTTLVLLAIAYWRATDFSHSVPFGLAATALAALFAGIGEYLHRARPKPVAAPWSEGVYLAAGFAGLSFALTMVLDKGWLTVAVALLCPALAWVEARRPVPVLRPLAAGLAAVVALRLLWHPLITDEPGQTPIFNWLLYAYGIPALAFALTGTLFGRRRRDMTVQIFEAAAIVFTAALAALQVRHLLNDGDIVTEYFDLTELSVHSLIWLGLSYGLRRLDLWRRSLVSHYAAIGFGLIGTASLAIGHLVVLNPLVSGDSVGAHPVFNVLLLAYLLPGAAAALIYATDPADPRPIHVRALGAAGLVLIFAWLSLQVRALFAGGGVLNTGIISDSEWYVYSAVWLLYGLSLLGTGIILGSAALRHGAFAVIVLTIAKVFLFDMSNLTGIFRALSFLGLGAVLIGIGYLYQKIIFPQARPDEPA